jgi:hypothetical protein
MYFQTCPNNFELLYIIKEVNIIEIFKKYDEKNDTSI